MQDHKVVELELETSKEHKLWRGELAGTTVRTTIGKPGAKGRTIERAYASPRAAREAFTRALAAQHKKGYFPRGEAIEPLVPPASSDGTGERITVLPLPVSISTLIDVCPVQLESYQPELGYHSYDGPGETRIWLPTKNGKARLTISQRHRFRPVEPKLEGASDDFPFTFRGFPQRPDASSFLCGFKTALYEVDIASAQARTITRFASTQALGRAAPFRYSPSGRSILHRDHNQLIAIDSASCASRVIDQLDGQPILDMVTLAHNLVAVAQDDRVTVYLERDGVLARTHRLAVRSAFGLGSLLGGRVLVVATRSGTPRQTMLFSVHGDGIRPLVELPERTHRAFDARGGQWLTVGEYDESHAVRLLNVAQVLRATTETAPLPPQSIVELPSLHDAIADGPDRVVDALAQGALLEARDRTDRMTPLGYAAWYGRLEIVDLLLEAGAKIDAVSGTGRSPLSYALERSHRDVAERLFAAGAAPGLAEYVTVEGSAIRTESPIVAAARAGHLGWVTRLLDANAPIDIRGADGATSLHLAVAAGNTHLGILLLERGASIMPADDETPSILSAVAAGRSVELANRIVLRSSDVSESAGSNALRSALLGLAVGEQVGPIVDVLIEHGARSSDPEVLRYAVEAQHVCAITALLAAGADPNSRSPAGTKPDHPLCSACFGDAPSLAVVKALLDGGADVNAVDSNGISAVRHVIATSGNLEVVELLLATGAQLEATASAWGPLHEAARRGRSKLVSLLLERGAPIDGLTPERTTALTLAVVHHHNAVAEQLLEAGANPNLGAFTPLMSAAGTNQAGLVQRLLAHDAEPGLKGADPYAEAPRTPASAQQHAELAHANAATAVLAALTGCAFSTLHGAVEADAVADVRRQLAEGADPNEHLGPHGVTPLHLARTATMIDILVEAGAKPDPAHLLAYTTSKDPAAAQRVSALIRHGVDAFDQLKALSRAASYGNRAVARVLLDAGCAIDPRTKRSDSPLHAAAEANAVDVIELLISRGANVNAIIRTFNDGLATPLHAAAEAGSLEAAKLLLEHGAEVGATGGDAPSEDELGFTAIHRAALAGHDRVLALLLAHDAAGAAYQTAGGATLETLAEDHPACAAVIKAHVARQQLASVRRPTANNASVRDQTSH
ncbi:MAG: ankyrin repeat domain-containing protein [Kofleriaceae bacterium]